MDKQYSNPEKYKAFKEHGVIEHWMFVHELQELLSHLDPNDWITPNTVGNLKIEREGREGKNYIGYIDFANNTVEFLSREIEEGKTIMLEHEQTFIYYFINRPPFIGTHPTENLIEQSAVPISITLHGFNERRFHGYASYSKKLDFEQVWNYELLPADEQELVAYAEWREENNK